ncbi:MAG TPA: DUF4038 domain-containing protein, partial [archaeon]|nr:DUF4038 domain-containing protein [archaeon]
QCFKTSSGEAFYPVADTAWLLGKLSNSEIEEYIKKRSEQGFNVIKFSSSEGDFTKHDFIFNTLKKYNMYAETGPDVGQANGIAYVNRYKNRDNLFAWIVGGLDSGASSGDVSALLSSVRAADSTHLISAHPKSGKSLVSDHGISTSLIDFYYVHKCTPGALGSLLTGEISRSPKKPVYLGEPVYEGRFAGCGCTSGCSADQSYSQITEAITAGAAGISHGHHSVWSFNLGGSSWGVDPSTSGTPWRSALNSSGSQKIISIITTLRNDQSNTTQTNTLPPQTPPPQQSNFNPSYNKFSKFLWKPRSDSDGKLVVLYSGKSGTASIIGPNGKTIETGQRTTAAGVKNGYQDGTRFLKSGSSYPNGSYVVVGNYGCKISSTGSRITKCV